MNENYRRNSVFNIDTGNRKTRLTRVSSFISTNDMTRTHLKTVIYQVPTTQYIIYLILGALLNKCR